MKAQRIVSISCTILILYSIFFFYSCREKSDEEYIKEYTEEIENDPSGMSYAGRGDIYFGQRQFKKALEDYKNANNFLDVNYQIAGTYLMLHDIKNAQQYILKQLQIDDKFSYNHGLSGICHDFLSDKNKAIEEYSIFLKRREYYKDEISKYFIILARRSILKYHNNEFSEALWDMNEAIKIDSSNCSAYYWRFKINIKLNKINEALNDLKESLQCGFNDTKDIYSYIEIEKNPDKKQIDKLVEDYLVKKSSVMDCSITNYDFIINTWYGWKCPIK